METSFCKRDANHPQHQKVIHFKGPLTIGHIRGSWFPSMRDGSFAVVWGNHNVCFAYLHDFDFRSREILIDQCRIAIYNHEHPLSPPNWGRNGNN